ncbi:spore germination protein [Alkaliphilus peptidifermentans]|uniref:Spore germination protein n=1 Tax=Alkaliphilus peptidifermentans DSM 18978 TaxID=1120976 RepID=A0A1G5KJ12_9FIRM|nr:spore germination protein [Alkaliphilus peptidifermentans]SCZ00090.1 spore germination protein [Alkaliphilus peptidifermentans DSM 18978]
MGLWKKLLGNKGEKKQQEGTSPHKNIDTNLKAIKDIFEDCDDIVYREIEVGVDSKIKAALIYVDGMADKFLLNDFILDNIMVSIRTTPPKAENVKKQLASHLKDHTLAVSEMKEVETIEEGIDNILSGETVLLLDEYDKIIIIASKGWQARGVSEPVTETVIRGPRDGFVETFRVNTALIRRRIRDPKLKLKTQQVGVRSKTDLAILYIDDIVDKRILKEVESRIEKIDMDAILDSGYVEQLIEDNWFSPFPQVQNTERPDVTAAALYEGRIVIIADNSPFALIVPTTLNSMLQSSEDYYERWNIATAVRLLRYFAAFVSLILPSLYVAITSFHPQMIPTKLTLALAANRKGVPFPAIVEALIMETTIELLREAGVRLPGPIGATIGIVGGLVIGQAAVEAGIVAPLMVIIVAITAIASFAIPSYNVAIGFRLLRFLFIFAAGFLGLYGVILAILLLLSHLCSLKSFGIPYLHPFVNFVDDIGDMKDTFVRAPMPSMNNRETVGNKKQKNRLDDKREEFRYEKEDK